MLPTRHRQAYQNFLFALMALQEIAATPQPEAGALERGCQQVQQVFQAVPPPAPPIPTEEIARYQSIQREIYRSLRLLATDFLFWRASRQAATSQQRLAVLRHRLEVLIGYCQGALERE
jgi:hypothetical protein